MIDEIVIISSKLVRLVGSRSYLLYLSPQMALDLHVLRSIVSERRKQVDGRRAEFSRAERGACWGAASRNSDPARRHWLRELATAKVADGGPIRAGSGDIMDEPLWRRTYSLCFEGGFGCAFGLPDFAPGFG